MKLLKYCFIEQYARKSLLINNRLLFNFTIDDTSPIMYIIKYLYEY